MKTDIIREKRQKKIRKKLLESNAGLTLRGKSTTNEILNMDVHGDGYLCNGESGRVKFVEKEGERKATGPIKTHLNPICPQKPTS
jgi:hypothetical protein